MEEEKQKRRKIIRHKIVYILVDILILSLSFFLIIWYKPATVRVYLPTYFKPFLFFAGVWLFVSFIISKYNLNRAKKYKDVFYPILITNLTILAVTTTLIYNFGALYYSRLIVFGTILLSTLLELGLGYLYVSFKRPVIVPEFDETKIKKPKYYPADKTIITDKKEDSRYLENREQIKQTIIKETGDKVYDYISKYVDVGNPSNLLLTIKKKVNVDLLPAGRYKSLVNLHPVNDIRYLNKFFESVNSRLPYGGIYINNGETYVLRKERIMKEYPFLVNHFYYFFDFLFTRVTPKLPGLKKFYFWVTLGQNRVLSRAEILGRLYSCGFEVIDENFIEGKFYFVVRKVKEPAFDSNPTYGPFVRLKRYGRNGKVIGVFKMRTMHAYSEYLQEYVYMKYRLQEGGKFNNDFRVTAVGKMMRKFWIDELPMIFNLLVGDMKLVGVRPLSKHYFNLYTEELREKRSKVKPGLVPPFYADMPKTLEEIMESEMRYLEAYDKSPFWTDTRYFFQAIYNIVFRSARSK